MRRTKAVMLVLLGLTAGCAQKTGSTDDVNRLSDTGVADTTGHQQYLMSAEQKLADYDARLDTLRTRLAAADARARVKIQENIDLLSEQRRQAQTRLDELRAATVETWERTRTAFVTSLDSLDARFDRARERMR